MKNLTKIIMLTLCPFIVFLSCKKSFLDAKPSTTIVTPNTLTDLQGLLENAPVLNSCTPLLSLLASDDHVFVDFKSWQATETALERNSYIWSKDLYSGQTSISDWRLGYSAIFYCNNILEVEGKIIPVNTSVAQYNLIKGWALFIRGYAFFDLVRNFSPVYNASTATVDLGLPIRLNPGIDEIIPRSTLKASYNQVIQDVEQSIPLLEKALPLNSNRPSKAAAYALLSRIYLSMNIYDKAEFYADSALAITSKLIDYNTVSKTASNPFPVNNDETIFCTNGGGGAPYFTSAAFSGNTAITINPELIKLYDKNDLRLSIFFALNTTNGNLYNRRRYYPSVSPFTGLANDEVILNKAECLARRNQNSQALLWLNSLLKKRYLTNTFQDLSVESTSDVLNTILLERRKELVWRCLRWTDLKRLNVMGANITLSRILNGVAYTLAPNDPRYVFPIPDDEISLSGIQQNVR